jgi:hypothetical protein
MEAPESCVPNHDRAGWSRTERLFIGTAAMLLGGILLPGSSAVLDSLWILQLSLTAAVVLAGLSAQNSSQLEGFPLLTAAASMLSFLTVSGSLRAVVFGREHCGRLVGMLGQAVASAEPLLALLTVFVLGFFLVYLVRLSGRRMHSAAEDYFFRILPFKKAGLEADRSLKLINAEQAQNLAEKIRKEIRFYASMEQIRKLLLAQITVHVFLLLTGWPLAWLAEWFRTASVPSGQSPLEALAPPLVGTALLGWIPPAIAAGVCAALLSKESLALPAGETPKDSAPRSRTIQIRSSVSGQPEEIELLNPQSLTGSPLPVRPTEQLADFEPSRPAASSSTGSWEIQPFALGCTSCEDYYEGLAAFLSWPDWEQSCVLLTSESVKDLPVNAVVHPALRLVRREKKILLLDADARKAVAKVFSLDPAGLTVPTPVPGFEGLRLQTIVLEEWMQNPAEPISEGYFRQLIYAPQAFPPQGPLSSRCINSILLFSRKTPEQIQSLLAGCGPRGRVVLLPPLPEAVRPRP